MNFFKENIDKSLEKILNSFLSKIHFGKLEVQFPSGQKKLFIGYEDGHFASLKIHSYKFLSLIFKKGSIGFAEAYIKGFYSTTNLTNLLMLSHKNENYFLDNKRTNIFFSIYLKP